jgi:MFS transporter, putative metabolite transport protein
MTAFLFPILLTDVGTAKLLYLLVGTSLLGAAVTWLFRIETAGVNLEEIGAENDEDSVVGTASSVAPTAAGE